MMLRIRSEVLPTIDNCLMRFVERSYYRVVDREKSDAWNFTAVSLTAGSEVMCLHDRLDKNKWL